MRTRRHHKVSGPSDVLGLVAPDELRTQNACRGARALALEIAGRPVGRVRTAPSPHVVVLVMRQLAHFQVRAADELVPGRLVVLAQPIEALPAAERHGDEDTPAGS